ncbi:MAG TPA: hypothetical protein VME17_21570 [Bryobacteraceae bacterium]|nr:hypothetical protein [Bryobacteraceae bacterium]
MNSHFRFVLIASLACGCALAQPADPPAQPASATAAKPASPQPGQTESPPAPDKRIFGVLPNYRTANETAVYTPITPKQKLTIAAKDSFDYPLLGLSAFLAGYGQLTNSNPSFGQGWAGYGRRVGVEYGDQAIGNMMTEGLFPIMLREDPRYFRRGHGPFWSRTWYAATRVFVTKNDNGSTGFNFAEIVGNATGTAISNAYTPDQRNVGDNIETWWMQIGIDSASQVLKEFWPDIKHKLFHGPNPNPDAAALSGSR